MVIAGVIGRIIVLPVVIHSERLLPTSFNSRVGPLLIECSNRSLRPISGIPFSINKKTRKFEIHLCQSCCCILSGFENIVYYV
jgi:hypothetical protein